MGDGLCQKIQESYQFLAYVSDTGDDIFWLGFSWRGKRRRWGELSQRFLRASSSSRVRGQSEPRRRERLRSARTFPLVWHCGQ